MTRYNSTDTKTMADPDDIRPVLLWWACLSLLAVFNIAILLRRARTVHSLTFHLNSSSSYPPWLRSIRDQQLTMSSLYVWGCAYRSVLPCHHTLRRVLVNSVISSGFVGRCIATIAELGAACQAALLLREISTATVTGGTVSSSLAYRSSSDIYSSRRTNGGNAAFATSHVIVPMIVIAEISSWYACLTTNYIGSIIEEGIWACCAILMTICFLEYRHMYVAWSEQWIFLHRTLILTVMYSVYMTMIDVPNYVRSHLANGVRGATYFSLADGLTSLYRIEDHDWTWRYDDWRYAMIWMTLYFSIACWASIGIVIAPRMDLGLLIQHQQQQQQQDKKKKE